ncbi:MAG: hypothetical protein NC340_03410 [Ruminococcus flavefaciens]|nr:hypothetical protein [Ruminococcus flavefaciens]MCM1229602.1 hypothetical protein [Ruminococcus flavefaciens]
MHRRFIYVPKTAEDMKQDWYGDETADIYEWRLSDDEFQALWDCNVFEYLNVKFDVSIYEYEEELIMYQYLYCRYDELIDELNCFGCGNEIKKLIEMINRAIESKTYIEFDL